MYPNQEQVKRYFEIVTELERIGVKHQINEDEEKLYLHIPRDLCKSHIQEYIDYFKSVGFKVFSRVVGVDELFNCNGDLLKRTKPLSTSEIVNYAQCLLDASENGKDSEVEYATSMFYKITDKEKDKILEAIQDLKLLDLLKHRK